MLLYVAAALGLVLYYWIGLWVTNSQLKVWDARPSVEVADWNWHCRIRFFFSFPLTAMGWGGHGKRLKHDHPWDALRKESRWEYGERYWRDAGSWSREDVRYIYACIWIFPTLYRLVAILIALVILLFTLPLWQKKGRELYRGWREARAQAGSERRAAAEAEAAKLPQTAEAMRARLRALDEEATGLRNKLVARSVEDGEGDVVHVHRSSITGTGTK